MNIRTRNIIKAQIVPYISSITEQKIGKRDTLFKCPCCKSEKPSAAIFPANSDRIVCHSPTCAINEDIFGLVRKIEDMPQWSDDDVKKYITKVFKIKLPENDYQYFDMYQKLGWCLFQVSSTGDTKQPIERGWPESEHKNPEEWKDWVDRGLNIGLNLKKSNVLALDIDSEDALDCIIDEENDLKLRDVLVDTLEQKTNKGYHHIYEYDPDFKKTLNKVLKDAGFNFELRIAGAYILIAPSSSRGEVRSWTVRPVQKMDERLKSFLMKFHGDVADKSVDAEIQQAIDDEQLDKISLTGLDGMCNDSFIKFFGVLRKKLPRDYLEYTAYNFNNLLASPFEKKTIRTMLEQIESYRTVDKKDLAQKVLNHLEVIEEGTAFEICTSLKCEKKDIEDVLRYLLDEGLVYKARRGYKVLKKVKWRDTFVKESARVDFKMPFFEDYHVFRNGDMIVIGAPPGVGKCFGVGTKILMHDGSYKNVENINLGDEVMGVDSKPRTVLGLSGGADEMYEIIPIKGKKCVVNSNHILSLKNTNTKKIINISVKDYLGQSNWFKHEHKLYHATVEFSEKEPLLPPYFLGLWLGDGDTAGSSITNPDNEVYEYLLEFAASLNMGVTDVYRKNQKHCRKMRVTTGKMGVKDGSTINEKLREIEVLGNKHIPDVYKHNSRENRLQLLAGLLDSDGHYSHGGFEIICKTDKLADDIRYLAGSLGFCVTHSIKKVKLKTWDVARPYHRLRIIGDCGVIPTKIKRKQAEPRIINKDPLVTGFDVVSIGKGQYYGFQLDGDQLHMIEDFFVHHNSTISLNFAKGIIEQGIKPYYINLEPGNRFVSVATQLGLKEGDFYWTNNYNPQSIELEDNAVTIIDWLLCENHAETDQMYKKISEQQDKHGGILLIMTQLNEFVDRSTGKKTFNFYAKGQLKQFPAFIAQYNYDMVNGVPSNIYTSFKTEKIRESKVGRQHITIPMFYEYETRIVRKR